VAGRVPVTPFKRLDRVALIDAFRSLQTRDQDVLYAQRSAWLAELRRHGLLGTTVGVAGGALVVARILTLVGVALVLVGWFAWRRAQVGRVEVEAAYSAFMSEIRDLRSAFGAAAPGPRSEGDRLPRAAPAPPPQVGSNPQPRP
jgi:hypothetical protein